MRLRRLINCIDMSAKNIYLYILYYYSTTVISVYGFSYFQGLSLQLFGFEELQSEWIHYRLTFTLSGYDKKIEICQ